MSDTGDDDSTLCAVIGMAGRFPGAADVNELWRNLRAGVESVRDLTDAELLDAGESPDALADPTYVRACPVLDDIDRFDAGFFGFSPREAAITDPQHRLFLETAWAAVEDAGHDPGRFPGQVGVFATCGLNAYMMHHLVTNQDLMESVGEWLLRHTGNDMNFLATRVSYELDLRGPSMNVQTACSSSLVAIHLATQSLLGGECDLALAGGSTIALPQRGYLYKEGEILSADGHCRPFDERSQGTLFGSGVGCVVLRRLADARKDGDHVLAIVRGSAINNDGAQKVGYLAPSVDGQARVIAEALTMAGVDADSVTYIEAHGTATAIGDPIEVAALTQAFRAQTARTGFCAIGSLKSNIGHLGEAAGVAGFIKTVLALGHREIPPSLNFTRPNRAIDFAVTPFTVADRLLEWRSAGGPRRAGVTALGAGGTNAHIILEEAPAAAKGGPARPWQLVVISAHSDAALDAATTRLARHLRASPELTLADAAYTLQVGRKPFARRRIAVCRDRLDAADVLEAREPKRLLTHTVASAKPDVAFLFPGGGAQHAGMGQELYDREPVYRGAVDACLGHVAADLRPLLFPGATEREAANARLEDPALALPALFATEYALAQLLQSWGITPSAMIGHSMGEYVAACVAGVLSPRDGMRLVAVRGRLFATLHGGGMLIVPLPAGELAELAGSELSIAAVNAPGLCVASGPLAAVTRLEALLAAREVEAQRVRIDVAAHSAMLDPILPEFERFCRTVTFHPPARPYVSNLTGTWIRAEEATDPRYWVDHLRHTVRFADGIAAIVDSRPGRVLLEVGPGRTLTSLALAQRTRPAAAVPAMLHPKDSESGLAFLLGAVGQLWLNGVELDWERLHSGGGRRRVSLPTYPFERQRHWIDRGARQAAAPATGAPLRKTRDPADWFFLPSWRKTVTPAPPQRARTRLVFLDDGLDDEGLGERLVARCAGAVAVSAGAIFAHAGPGRFTIDPGQRADMERLFVELRRTGFVPDEILHLYAVAREGSFARCFASLLHLGQMLALEDRPARLTIVSSGLHRIGGDTDADPLKALLLGPARVLPAELPALTTRSVDVVWPAPTPWQADETVEQLLAEADATDEATVIAYRGRERLVQTFAPAHIDAPVAGRRGFRDGGVYLITGGLGGIGGVIAEHLARTARARLILVGRTVTASSDRAAALEALGAEVLVEAADVTDVERMRVVFATARARFGPLTGIIHAAGVLDDELIPLKNADAAARVIAPKVQGALVLETLAAEADPPPELFLLFSSVSSILGPQGQVDYTAANAALDAIAARRAARAPGLSVAIDWGAWRDVGMAAVLAARARGGGVPDPSQPWFGVRLPEATSTGRVVYGRDLGRDDLWMLAEHVVRGGDALLPGTGFLELARAALVPSGPVELEDFVFLAPFTVAPGARRALRVSFDPATAELAIESGLGAAATRHATGKIAALPSSSVAHVDLAALRSRCASPRHVTADGFLPQRFMDFGPRWGNIRSIGVGRGEALLELELPAAFAADLERHALHPALLDMATGAAQTLIPGFDPDSDFHVPFAYGRVRLFRALPGRLWSHVRHQPGSPRELPAFDVTLLDDAGGVVAEINGFVMKRIADRALLGATPAPAPGPTSAATALREAAFREGMLPAEGLDALERIVSARVGPQVIASSLDLHAWLAAARAASRPPAPSASASVSTAPRPSVSTAFVAPRDDWEERIAVLWRGMLGVEAVGVHDNFFELGGHSLLLTQTVTRLRKIAEVDIPLRNLLSRLTIAEMAEEVARVKAGAGPASPPPMRAVAREGYRVKRSSLAPQRATKDDETG